MSFPLISIKKTWDQYIQPTTTLSYEEATSLVAKRVLMTPANIVASLKEIAAEHPKQ